MLDRRQAPEIAILDSFEIKQATTNFLDSGNPVHFLNAGTQEIIRLEFVFPAGSWFETKSGLSYLASKMMLEGTKSLSSKQIADKIALYGAFIETHQGYEHLNITLFLLEKHLDSVLPIILDIFNNSTFPQYEFENLKSVTNQLLRVNLEKNQFLASVNFRKALFGSSHPYGRQYWEADLAMINREEIAAFAISNINFQKCEIFVSGRFSESRILSLLNGTFKSSVGSYTKTQSADFPFKPLKEKKLLVEKSDAMQSSIRIGNVSINRSHEDFISFLILNEILGGFFGSRLMKNIREDKGFTYGIHSGIHSMQQCAYFAISTDVKKENTQETIDEIYKEINILQRELILSEELETVTSYMRGRFLNSLSTPFALMDKYKTVYYSNMTYDYYSKFNEKLADITSEELMMVANKYLNVTDFSEVVVGGK